MPTSALARDLGAVSRVVVKLGSSIILHRGLGPLVDEVQAARGAGVEVILVTSGAVAVGQTALGIQQRPRSLAKVQALAALGQGDLMARYRAEFGRFDVGCAQILLTHEDLADRTHFLNVRQTMREVLGYGLIPIINENDSVATEELRFGDNDRLAAAIATVVDADLVVLLSDVDSLCDKDPRLHDDALPIHEIDAIDATIVAMAGAAGAHGTGGMASKIAAAGLAVEAGIPLIVAPGHAEGVLTRILAGELLGTRFVPPEQRVDRRRHWIQHYSKRRGAVTVDAGAVKALTERRSSLLPAGVVAVEGTFERGDAVSIIDEHGATIALGLVGYDAPDLSLIAGQRSSQAARTLGREAVGPVVHRNDLVLQDEAPEPLPAS